MKKRRLLLLVSVLLLVLCLAAEPEQGVKAGLNIGSAGDVFFCSDTKLGIAEISSPAYAPNFKPGAGKKLWTGARAPATWLRFTLPGEGKAGQPLILAVRPTFSIILDHVALYLPRGDGGFDELRSGAMESLREGEPPAAQDFLFALPVEAFSGKPVYLRLSSATDVLVEVWLEKSVDLAQRQSVDYLSYGILYGILLAMVVYGLFIVLTLKDKAYLYYVLYSVSAGLWLFFVQGHAKLLLGQHPGFDQSMLWLFAGCLATFGAVFTAEFLRLREGHKVLNPLFVILAGLGALVSVAGLAGWYKFAFFLSHCLGIALPLLALVAAAIRIVLGYSSAFYFLAAWFLMAMGGLIFSLMGLKLLPVTFLTVNAMSIGISAESLLFAMALAERFKRLEKESKRLEAVQAKYKELSLKDPLTGLYNKRYLSMKLDSGIKEAQKGSRNLSILVIDLDNLKAINDSLGHGGGDEVLKILAGTLTDSIREGDDAFRIGGDEFVVILPGIGRSVAGRVAERIRNHFALDSFREKEGINPTISLGVSECLPDDSPDSLMKRADEALYEAKRLGKDRYAER